MSIINTFKYDAEKYGIAYRYQGMSRLRYGVGIVGMAIRGQIGHEFIYRIRRGNGYFGSVDKEIYQDKYKYFVPSSINNVESAERRTRFKAGVKSWQDDLSEAEKATWNERAARGYHMSGYNLFLRSWLEQGVLVFVDRGDAANWDFVKTDFTCDGAWHKLDLSAIIPVGTKAIAIKMHILDDAVASEIHLRKDGNVNDKNESRIRTQVANVYMDNDLIVIPSTDRKIEYLATNTVFDNILIVVKGWWI